MKDNVHDALYSPATLMLGEIHLRLLRSANQMDALRWAVVKKSGRFSSRDLTDFGQEIGMDEIHWWVFKKEKRVIELREKTEEILNSADLLKEGALKLRNKSPQSYEHLLTMLKDFAEQYLREIEALKGYVSWLEARDPMAPRILFTYRVWGSTRMSDRQIKTTSQASLRLEPNLLRISAEIVLGVRMDGSRVYDDTRTEMLCEISEGMDPEQLSYAGAINLPESRVLTRAASAICNECVSYFTELRESLRNVLIDIEKLEQQRELIYSDSFWREFISKAAKAKTAEPQLWDFKETLTVWHPVKNAEDRRKARVTFAEDVASFANTLGGILVVGVNDRREIVGIGDGKELENRLKLARDVLAAHIKYDHEIAAFKQVVIGKKGEQKICLVVVISKAYQPVAVNDGADRFSYPVRRETGISRVAREDVPISKLHLASDNRDFMSALNQFVRDN
jgi:Schlafen, AlbA_2